jgi:hypothetical protein
MMWINAEALLDTCILLLVYNRWSCVCVAWNYDKAVSIECSGLAPGNEGLVFKFEKAF